MDWRKAVTGLRPSAARGMAAHVSWIATDFGRRDYTPLSAEDLNALTEILETEEVEAGQRILSPGEPAERAYIVERGEVDLFVRRGGRRALVSIQRAGGVFGDVPLLCEMEFPFIAIARTPGTLLHLDRDELMKLLATHPAIALRWLVNVVRRLERANRRVVELTVGDLRARVLALLADELLDERDQPTIGLTQAEVASLLGATRQSINRVIRKLADDGLVRQRYGEIEVVDPKRILELTGGSARVGVC